MIKSIAVCSPENENFSEENIDIQMEVPTGLYEKLLGYLDKPLNKETLEEIESKIQESFHEAGHTFIAVELPEQKVKNGKVVFHVEKYKIGKIDVVGNEWFSGASIKRFLGFRENETIDEADLLNAPAWINHNPFIFTEIILSPGKMKNATDLEIAVKDRLPLRFYTGVDNTGTSVTGNQRFFAGSNISVGLYHLLTYQFTASFDFSELLSHFGNLTLFFPWKHELIFYGAYSTIRPEIDGTDSSGEQIQVSGRYIIPFKPLFTPFQHQFLFGADYKRTNNSLFALGVLPNGDIERQSINDRTTNLFQFYLGYRMEDHFRKVDLTFNVDVLFSPFKFLPHQTSFDYAGLRPGANTRYIYARGAVGANCHLPKNFVVSSLLRGQIASGALLPSEQFGLGGYDTVRGYQQNVYLADNTILGNFEIRSPYFSFFRSKIDSLMFLTFLDVAYGTNWDSSAAFRGDAWLMGAGAGMRYTILPYLTTRLDYGFRIHNTSFGNDQIGRVHFSAIVSY